MDFSKLKYLIPNGLTLTSLTLGIASIYNATLGRIEIACWLIIYAAIFDKSDGIAARLLNASSKIGLHLDSFADFVSFGIAPAILYRAILLRQNFQAAAPRCLRNRAESSFPLSEFVPLNACYQHYLSLAFTLIYIYGAALRLSRFNAKEQTEMEELAVARALNKPPPKNTANFIVGFASTFAGGFVALVVLTALKFSSSISQFQTLLDPLPFSFFLFLNGIMMNAPVVYAKPGTGQMWLKVLFALSFLVVLPLVILQIYPEIPLILVISAMFGVPLVVKLPKKSLHLMKEE